MHTQTILPETMTTMLETLEALEQASARLVRAVRHAARDKAERDAAALEYDSWFDRSAGELEYDSWAKPPR